MKPTLLTGEGLAALLAGAAAALVVFYTYVYRQEARQARRLTPGRKATLRLLRILVALLVLLALAKPAIILARHERRPPVVAFLVDESSSMAFPDARENPLVEANPPERRSRFDTAQSAVERLQKKLTLTHQVKVYAFSDALRLLKELPPRASEKVPPAGREDIFAPATRPAGEYTNIGDAVRDGLRELSSSRISGVVLLSDGRQTGGAPLADVRDEAAAAKVPVHALAFGTEYPLRDLRIDEVIVGPESSLGDVLTFHVKVTNQVSAPLSTKLALSEEGKTAAEKSLTLPRGRSLVSIAAIPETEGTREFRLSFPVYPDEVNAENNSAAVSVRIVKRTLRVLLVAGEPTLEYHYMVPALLRDPVVDLSCYLQSADVDYVQQGRKNIERLPQTLKDWTEYDVAILYDVDPNGITTPQMAGLENMVSKGGGLMVIAGKSHGLAKLVQVHVAKIRELLPVEVDKNLHPDHDRVYDRPFSVERAAAGRGHPVLLLDATLNEELWKTFPQFYWHHPVDGPRPKAVVLLERAGAGEGRGGCLMALRRYGEGAVFFSALNSLWRWRYPYESYDYDRLWTRVIRYLGETRLRGAQQQVALDTDRNTYAPGEEVRLNLRVLDPALMEQLSGQPLFVSVTGPQKDETMVPLRPEQDGTPVYRGRTTARRTGSMVARARQSAPGADSEQKPLFDVKHGFQVRMQSLEDRDTSADLEAMRDLADRTGGKYFDYRMMRDLDSLADAIPKDPQVLTREIRVDAWDGAPFLALFLMLVVSEWCLRKFWGLL